MQGIEGPNRVCRVVDVIQAMDEVYLRNVNEMTG